MTDFLARYGPLGYENRKRQLGRSIELGRPSKYGLKQTLVFAGATAQGGGPIDGNSLAATMALTCTYDHIAGDVPPMVEGLIRWGTDGHQAECRFDWKKGTVIQVCGSSAELFAEVVDGQADPIGDGDLVRVGAFIGYYPVTRCRPTLTQSQTVPAAAPLAFEVPDCACRVRIYPAEVGAGFEATLQTLAGAALASWATPGEVVPVINGADALVVANTSGGDLRFTLVWDLMI